jgi:tetratricopeptide (TPR) repeat protein
MAAAGLWTTPTDLAKFAIEIALSKQGKSNHVLSEKMTKEMLTPVKDEAGLGFFLEKANPGEFGHNGADEGFQALLEMNADTGNGVAMTANSDNGLWVMNMVLRRVASEYGWNYRMPENNLANLLLIANLKGVPAALQRYDELKKSSEAKIDEGTLNVLGYQLLASGQTAGAIAVFQKNVQQYPQSFNVYDSLGEAYEKAGQKDLAIQNYEKSIQLNPKNENGARHLKKLKSADSTSEPKS